MKGLTAVLGGSNRTAAGRTMLQVGACLLFRQWPHVCSAPPFACSEPSAGVYIAQGLDSAL